MKAKTYTNRVLTTIGFLLLTVTIGNGQDLLADGSTGLFYVDFYAEPTASNIITADNSDEYYESVSDMHLESELITENWMTKSFSESLEAEIVVETWMAESFSSSLESQVETEEWMTVSFTKSSEKEKSVEVLMTQAFIAK